MYSISSHFRERHLKHLDVQSASELKQFIVMRQMFVILQFYLIEKLNKDKVYENIDGMEIELYGSKIKLHYFRDEMDAYLSDFQWAVLSNYTVNIFEGIKRYCKMSGQWDKFQKEQYFTYFYVVRNSFSHDSRWNFGKIKYKNFPLKYKKHIIYFNEQKQPMASQGYSFESFWHLTNEILGFVDKKLK